MRTNFDDNIMHCLKQTKTNTTNIKSDGRAPTGLLEMSDDIPVKAFYLWPLERIIQLS